MPIAEFFSGIGEAYNIIISYEFIFESKVKAETGIKNFILGDTDISEGIGDAAVV